MTGQALSLTALKMALSEERLQAYAIQEDTDLHDAVARYFWNVALVSAMGPALHALEVTFRNHLYANSLKIIDPARLAFRDVECWLDADPTLLEPAEAKAVDDAKELLQSSGHLTPGRLIAKLSFGFWISLCKRPYEQGRTTGPALWPELAKCAFPFMKRDLRTRSQIYHRLDQLRELRNRVSHHEPIWDRPLEARHAEVVETIGWMNQGLARLVNRLSPLPAVFVGGHRSYRGLAIDLVSS